MWDNSITLVDDVSNWNNPIVLIDGVCNCCNWWVQFIIKHDPGALFKFATLQSRTGQRLQAQHKLCPESFRSLVLIDGISAFVKSDAILRIAIYFPGIWPLFSILYLIPRSMRNYVYDFIAKNQHRGFDKSDSNMLQTEDILHRFIE